VPPSFAVVRQSVCALALVAETDCSLQKPNGAVGERFVGPGPGEGGGGGSVGQLLCVGGDERCAGGDERRTVVQRGG